MWNGEAPNKELSEVCQRDWNEIKERHKVQRKIDQEKIKMLDDEGTHMLEKRASVAQQREIALDTNRKLEKQIFEASETLKDRKSNTSNILKDLSDVETKRNIAVNLSDQFSKYGKERRPIINEKLGKLFNTLQMVKAVMESSEKKENTISETLALKKKYVYTTYESMKELFDPIHGNKEFINARSTMLTRTIERYSVKMGKYQEDVEEGKAEYEKGVEDRKQMHQEQLEKIKINKDSVKEEKELLYNNDEIESNLENNLSEMDILKMEISILKESGRKMDDQLHLMDNDDTPENQLISEYETKKELMEKLCKDLNEGRTILSQKIEFKMQLQNEARQFNERGVEENHKIELGNQEKEIAQLESECLKFDEESRMMELSIEQFQVEQTKTYVKLDETIDVMMANLTRASKYWVREVENEKRNLEEMQETNRDNNNEKRIYLSEVMQQDKKVKDELEKRIEERKEMLERMLEEIEKMKVKIGQKTEMAEKLDEMKLLVKSNEMKIKLVKESKENLVNELEELEEEIKKEREVSKSLDDKQSELQISFEDVSRQQMLLQKEYNNLIKNNNSAKKTPMKENERVLEEKPVNIGSPKVTPSDKKETQALSARSSIGSEKITSSDSKKIQTLSARNSIGSEKMTPSDKKEIQTLSARNSIGSEKMTPSDKKENPSLSTRNSIGSEKKTTSDKKETLALSARNPIGYEKKTASDKKENQALFTKKVVPVGSAKKTPSDKKETQTLSARNPIGSAKLTTPDQKESKASIEKKMGSILKRGKNDAVKKLQRDKKENKNIRTKKTGIEGSDIDFVKKLQSSKKCATNGDVATPFPKLYFMGKEITVTPTEVEGIPAKKSLMKWPTNEAKKSDTIETDGNKKEGIGNAPKGRKRLSDPHRLWV